MSYQLLNPVKNKNIEKIDIRDNDSNELIILKTIYNYSYKNEINLFNMYLKKELRYCFEDFEDFLNCYKNNKLNNILKKYIEPKIIFRKIILEYKLNNLEEYDFDNDHKLNIIKSVYNNIFNNDKFIKLSDRHYKKYYYKDFLLDDTIYLTEFIQTFLENYETLLKYPSFSTDSIENIESIENIITTSILIFYGVIYFYLL